MLVLTRKPQEKIRIGDDIVITVLRMKGKAVRLGIEAPGNVQVLRGELVFDLADDTTAAGEEPEETSQQCPAGFDDACKPRRSTASTLKLAREPRPSDVDIGLVRLPRENKDLLLAQLAHGHGPLRAMLDTRPVCR